MPSYYASIVREPEIAASAVTFFGPSTSGRFLLPDDPDSLVYYNTILANMGHMPSSLSLRSMIRYTAFYANPARMAPPEDKWDLRFRLNIVDEF